MKWKTLVQFYIIAQWNVQAFNINTDGLTEHVFTRAKIANTFGETSHNYAGTSFFGYRIFMELLNNGIEETIQLAIGAPSEVRQTYKNSETEEGSIIKEPNPQARMSLSSTTAMGAMYYCEITQAQLVNLSAIRMHNCSVRADVQRDLSGFEISERDALGISLSTEPLTGDGYKISEKNTIVTCAHLRQHDCGNSYKAEGACYVSETVPGRGDSQKVTKWHKRVPCRDSCFEKDIDLMFVVDGSFSVGNDSFLKVKKWIKDVTNGFDIKGQVQVGVVQYSYFYPNRPPSKQQYMKTEIALGQFKDKALFDEAVDAIKYHGYSTYTAHAINKTVKEDFNSGASRYPDARRVMILLTDGCADDAKELPGATGFAAHQGVESFAVGVGNFQNCQLELIAGEEGQVIAVENFDDLTGIVSELQRGIQIMEGVTSPEITNELMQCQAGISSTFDKSGGLYLGAVGAYDWSGTVIKYDSSSDTTPDIPSFGEVQRVLPVRPKESYLGYTVTSGFYNGRSNSEFVATGAPRYLLQGAVVIYRPVVGSQEFRSSQTIQAYFCNCTETQRQLGSYFGGSLLSVDVNNDGRDDLLVGAPLYTATNYDEGRAFVYLTQSSGNSAAQWASASYKPMVLQGGSSTVAQGGRFSTAMASAGDLNYDGYNDVVIGAPYFDNGRGAVFVFHGGANGLDPEPKQAILASDLPNANLQYFGLSLQGGQDLDNNTYPDLAVGAPKSDTVVIFRARPVAKFTADLTFNVMEFDIFECFATPFRQCLMLTACVNVTGVGIESTLSVNYTVKLDTAVSINKRAEFRSMANSSAGTDTWNGTITLTPGNRQCLSRHVFVKKAILDYDTPINASLTFDLTPSHTQQTLSSVRDPTLSNERSTGTVFVKNCLSAVCQYNLSVEGQLFLPPATLEIDGYPKDLTDNGSALVVSTETANTPILVKVNLTNTGETAFEVRVNIQFTRLLSWTNLLNVRGKNATLPCVVDTQATEDDLQSGTRKKFLTYQFSNEFGSIMPQDEWCYFEFNLSSNNLKDSGSLDSMFISVNAYTTERPADLSIWNTTNSVKYRADTAGLVNGNIADTRKFNFTTMNETVVSVRQINANLSDVTIVYTMNGNGHSSIPTSTMKLSYPSSMPVGFQQHLLYLYNVECTPNGAGCVCDQSLVNPYNLLEGFPNENTTTNNSVTIVPNTNTISSDTLFDCSVGNTAPAGVCQTLSCNVSDLGNGNRVELIARFRLWTQSLQLNQSSVTLRSGFEFSTYGSSLLINERGENVTVVSAFSDITAEKYIPPSPYEPTNNIWIYIVAAIAGLLLLIAIIAIMYKTGFFKSKYADMKQEALEWNDANGAAEGGTDNASTAGMME